MFDFIKKCPKCGHLMRIIDEDDWRCANCGTTVHNEDKKAIYESSNDINE